MSTMSYLRNYIMRVEQSELNISESKVLFEGKGHLDHPEDLVFLEGISGAKRAIKAILDTSQHPDEISIKWDGYPALIFGRGDDGRFAIMDKHMFNKRDGTGRAIHSPQEFRQYDESRGVDRSGLWRIIDIVWSGLESAFSNLNGYIWGDLLFSHVMMPEDGLYRFRANPNGITYTIDASSDIGRLFAEKDAGIAVHQYIASEATSTDQAVSLRGGIGSLRNVGNVAIVPSKLPVRPEIAINQRLVNDAQKAINTYASDVTNMQASPPIARASFDQLFTIYINKRIVSGDLHDLLPGFVEFYQTRPMSERAVRALDEYFGGHSRGLSGVFHIWAAIYSFKMSVVNQLDQAVSEGPVKGYLQNGRQSQEGFVSQGLKFVDRLGFSRQNLSNR